MRNHENSFDDQPEDRNTGWEFVGDNRFRQLGDEWEKVELVEAGQNEAEREADFIRRQNERIAERKRRMEESEKARAIMMKKVISALLAFSLSVGGVRVADAAIGHFAHENTNTYSVDKEETINDVKLVTITDGPNLRTDPYTTDREQRSNIIMNLRKSGQKVKLPYQDDVYRFVNPSDPNGSWYGFDAEKLANALLEGGYISEEEAKELTGQKDRVWVNGEYVRIDVANTETDVDSASNVNGV